MFIWLVVQCAHLENDGVKVNGNDYISLFYEMKSHKIPWFETTNQLCKKKHMFTCLRFQCFSDDEDVRSILVLPITKLICWITMVNLFRWNHPGNHCNHVSEGKSRTANSSNTLWLFVTSPLENHHAINR